MKPKLLRLEARPSTITSSSPMVAYDSSWPEQFERERSRILSAIGDKILAVEHVGSTAVPGLAAKPIIDILVGITRLPDYRVCIRPLGDIGYEYRPKNDGFVLGTEYFRKGPHGANTHHIRMVEHGGSLWQDYLLFRDYLRNHPDQARKYSKLKENLYAKHGRYLPLDAKKAFIDSVLTKAHAENPENRGKIRH